MKKILLMACMAFSVSGFSQLKLTYCDPANTELKVKNFGGVSVNISTYRLCSSFNYKILNAASGINILSGDFDLATGEEVYFQWTDAGTGFSVANDDMGLYLPSGSFGSAVNMVDFIEWGAGDQGREDVAVAANLWVEDEFVPTPGPFYYIGNGSFSGATQWSNQPPGGDPYTGVRINEVDPDQPSADAGEFIELYGDPNTSLDGLVVVFFQGSGGDATYAAYDLDGYSLDASGFFIMGNAAVPSVQLIFPGNSLQNGSDGIAIYVGDATDWPNGTLATATDIVDAIVYGTDDPVDAGLVAILTPGQAQLNDTGNSANSFSRVPDGGDALITTNYLVQSITPGFTNQLPCAGGTVALLGGGTSLDVCLDDIGPIDLTLSDGDGDNSSYILTNSGDTILMLGLSNPFDLTGLAAGTYHIWSVSYTGSLDNETTQPGFPLMDIAGDACLAFSSNFVTITITDCTLPVCDGGDLFTNDNLTFISVCADADADNYTFSNNGTGDVSYTYILTDFGSDIIAVLAGNEYDFNLLIAGQYHVYGVSHDGDLVLGSIAPGSPVNAVQSTGVCIDISANDITVYVTECNSVEGCTELFFSQYLEGSSNNKALEIYNPTPFPVDLDDYDLLGYFNGETSEGPVMALAGILQPGEVFVVVNSQADAPLLAQADMTGAIATFNGDDALVLTKNLEPVDMIGVIGSDPGTAWTFGTGSTQDKTLVRKPTVNSPTLNWIQSQGQWLVNNIDDFASVGSHTALPCSDVAFVGFTSAAVSVEESVGTLIINLQSFNVINTFDANISVTASSATAVDDYEDVFPLVLNVGVGETSPEFSIDIVDDLIQEGYEYITLTLTAPDAVTLNAVMTITIEPSDQEYPPYTIAQIIADANNNTLADSLGVFCAIRGVVHGIDFNPAGIHFHLVEGPAAIKIFDADDNFGYTVTEGDSVTVKGEVTQFMGMTEFFPDSIFYIDGGHPLESITLLNGPITEEMESHLVSVECVELVDATQWTNVENGFNVDVTDGTNTWTMRIDLDTDIYGTNPPSGHFSAVGIAAQFDTTGAPYDEGYHFWPRYLADFTDQVTASFIQFGDIVYGDDGVTINFLNTSSGDVNYDWDFGDGTTSDEEFPNKFYTYDFLSTVSDVTITLTVDNGAGCFDTFTYTTDAIYTGIDDYGVADLLVYPNPANDLLNIKSEQSIMQIRLTDASGRIVLLHNKNMGSRWTLDLSSLQAGLYELSVQTDSGFVHQRIVKK
ncbi:MAG: lamin tail domain-containing protein [Flavobacteriales bacterium]